MNKSAVSVIAVIGLGIVGLPPVLGTLSESQVRSRVAAISDSGYVELELQSFERGWFSSVASMELRLGPAYIEQLSAIGLASAAARSIHPGSTPIATTSTAHATAARYGPRPPSAAGVANGVRKYIAATIRK